MANEVNKQPLNKAGKTPLIHKGVVDQRSSGPRSALEVPDSVLQELKVKGLACRWIDIVQLKEKGGYHRQGWTPMKFDCQTGKSNPFRDQAMDGYLVSAGSVLAVKSLEEAKNQRDWVTRRTQVQSGGVESKEAFKQLIRSQKGVKIEEDSDSDED